MIERDDDRPETHVSEHGVDEVFETIAEPSDGPENQALRTTGEGVDEVFETLEESNGDPDDAALRTTGEGVDEVFERFEESTDGPTPAGQRITGEGVDAVLEQVRESNAEESTPEPERTAIPVDEDDAAEMPWAAPSGPGATEREPGPKTAVGERSVDDVFAELERAAIDERPDQFTVRDETPPGDPWEDVRLDEDVVERVAQRLDDEVSASWIRDDTPDSGEDLVGGAPDRVVTSESVDEVVATAGSSGDDASESASVDLDGEGDLTPEEMVAAGDAPPEPEPYVSDSDDVDELFAGFTESMAEDAETGADSGVEFDHLPSTGVERETIRFDDAMEWADERSSPLASADEWGADEPTTDDATVDDSATADSTDVAPTDDTTTSEASTSVDPGRTESEASTTGDAGTEAEPVSDQAADEGPGSGAVEGDGSIEELIGDWVAATEDVPESEDDDEPVDPEPSSGSDFVELAEEGEVNVEAILDDDDDDLPMDELVDDVADADVTDQRDADRTPEAGTLIRNEATRPTAGETDPQSGADGVATGDDAPSVVEVDSPAADRRAVCDQDDGTPETDATGETTEMATDPAVPSGDGVVDRIRSLFDRLFP